jgi:ATP-binding cassette subfamily B protein
MSDPDLTSVAWPMQRCGEALECLAYASQCLPARVSGELPRPPGEIASDPQLRTAFVNELAGWLSIEALAVSEQHAQIGGFLRRCAPALLQVDLNGAAYVLAVVGASARHVRVLDANGQKRRVSLDAVRCALTAVFERPLAAECARLLNAAELPERRRPAAQRALLNERLAHLTIETGWLVRRSSATSLAHALHGSRMPGLLLKMLCATLAQYALVAVAWQSAARGALLGHLDVAWLHAWLLALLASVPLTAASSWLSARFALEAGSWLRVRLFEGILRLDPDTLRGQGTGHLLGRIMEAGALEAFGLGAVLLAGFAGLDLAAAALLLARGPSAAWLLALLFVAVTCAVASTRAYYRRRDAWTSARLALTHDLIDRMLGHRTRAVQEPRTEWHDFEDRALAAYLADSRRFDGAALAVSMLPRCFVCAAFAGLTCSALSLRPSQLDLALAIGGILLASRALTALASGLAQLGSALIAFREVAPLLAPQAARRSADPTAASAAHMHRAQAALEARELTVHHAQRAAPVLSNIELAIRPGDHVLLEGASGSGKTTLAHTLAGLREAQHGLLLFDGLDRHTLGWSGWNRRVTVAPQYHDNHVLSGTLAFNLLLGRAWPASASDLADAERVCQEIGLGPLLARMPAGMQQIVGETGWQLSHGERGRLFAARAILSDADLVVLDESVAALDPETARAVLCCARERTRALMLIAHP